MWKAAPAALAVLLLAGCFEDRPSDKVAEPVIRKQAETDLVDGLALVDFKRDNGQVDPNSANRYKVTYTYRVQLTKPYAEVILGLASDLHAEWQGNQREPVSDFDLDALQGSMTLMQNTMAATQWINAQGDGFIARRDALLGDCQPCLQFWNSEDAPDQAGHRRTAYILAWSHLEGMQFQDSFTVGDGVDRHAWGYFEKTEKGWLPSN